MNKFRIASTCPAAPLRSPQTHSRQEEAMLSLSASSRLPPPTTASSVSLAALRLNLQGRQWANSAIRRSNRQKLLASVIANASQGKGSSGNEIIMVDPIEAKRLAAKQMKEIQAKEKLKRRRQAEAINGTLAMLGLTAGLIIEGQTGKGILGQLAGYWAAIISFFIR